MARAVADVSPRLEARAALRPEVKEKTGLDVRVGRSAAACRQRACQPRLAASAGALATAISQGLTIARARLAYLVSMRDWVVRPPVWGLLLARGRQLEFGVDPGSVRPGSACGLQRPEVRVRPCPCSAGVCQQRPECFEDRGVVDGGRCGLVVAVGLHARCRHWIHHYRPRIPSTSRPLSRWSTPP